MLLIFSCALFLSAALLFMVQPMMGKMVLPLLGGSPSVWNTQVAFCQTLLVLGYLYAHATARWMRLERQALLQGVLLTVPFLFIPFRFDAGAAPVEANPVLWLLGLLGRGAGIPFFVLATSSPVLQKWFSSIRHPRAADPYFLFAASNGGSLLGLVAYPTIIEPFCDLQTQGWLWVMGYGLLVAITLVCVLILWRSFNRPSLQTEGGVLSPERKPLVTLPWKRRLLWMAAAFVPSSLMLSVTTYLSTNIAPVPLLWVIPLALYLLSFVLVFSPTTCFTAAISRRLLPAASLSLLLIIVLGSTQPVVVMFAIHLLGLLIFSLALHGGLAQDRPSPIHLTEFYLWISLGGVAGGIFNSMLAPLVFTSLLEYPLVLLFGVFLVAQQHRSDQPLRRSDFFLPLALGLLVMSLVGILSFVEIDDPTLAQLFLWVLPAAICYTFSKRPLRFALGMGCLWLAGLQYQAQEGLPLYQERNFFGVHRVLVDSQGEFHLLSHSGTLHGKQSLDPSRRCLPLTYYHPSGPLGQFFAAFQQKGVDWKVAVVGLGTGSIASYGRPGQHWTFFEVDPTVIRIASDGRYFSYLRDCSRDVRIVAGDARISLQQEHGPRFDLIVLDAYSSDSIPVHLITREALDIYLERLSEQGILAFHISNQYLDLGSILAALADHAGLVYLRQNDVGVTQQEKALGKEPSEWVLLARSPTHLGPLLRDHRWQPHEASKSPLWTDSYSSILGLLNWTGR